MQFRSQAYHVRRRTYSQILSGVLLMLLGAVFLLSPLSARSQEPTPGTTAEPTISPDPVSPTDFRAAITDVATDEPTAAETQPSVKPTNLSATDEASVESTIAAEPSATDEPTATLVSTNSPVVAPTALVTPTVQPTALVTPTITLALTEQPDALVTPTLALVSPTALADEAPLTITMSAAATHARPLQHTNLTAIVDGSTAAGTARVEIELDPHLEAISASASSGTCAVAVPVVCTIHVEHGTPAVINIEAQVRPDAPAGGKLVSQAVARAGVSDTVASEPVAIDVHGSAAVSSPSVPVSTPEPSATTPPASTPEPSSTAVPVMSPVPTEANHDAVAPGSTPADTSSSKPNVIAHAATEALPSAAPATRVTSGAAPTSAPVATAPASTPSRVPLPDDVFTAPHGENQQLPTAASASATSVVTATPESPIMQSNNLPHTASHAPLLGWSSLLLGFALTAHGTRRIRQESIQWAAASREARQLEPLVDAITYLNGLVREEAEQMQQVSGEYVDMLKHETTSDRHA